MRIKQQYLAVILLIGISSVSWAQGTFRYGPDERAGEWNFSLGLMNQGSESQSGPNGSGFKLDDDWGFGFTVGYNFTNKLALGFEMSFFDPKYDYTFVPDVVNGQPQTISHRADFFNGLLRGTWNMLDGPVTPFLDATLGWTHIDSNVQDGPPVTNCWWDPWWGYICSNVYDTYSETEFSYGGGAGLRWDVNRDIFLRASYHILRFDGGASGDIDLGMARFEVGWRY